MIWVTESSEKVLFKFLQTIPRFVFILYSRIIKYWTFFSIFVLFIYEKKLVFQFPSLFTNTYFILYLKLYKAVEWLPDFGETFNVVFFTNSLYVTYFPKAFRL